MNQCPKCRRRLKAEAVNCLCGWTSLQEKHSYTPCAYADCSEPALCRVKEGHASVNLCVNHYGPWHTPERILKNNINHGERDNSVMAEIRRAYAAKHGAVDQLEKLGDVLAERMAA